MIELDVLKYLSETLDVSVYMERPEDVPEKFIIIEKTANSMSNHIEYPTIAIQCYAPTLYKAAELNEEVKSAMSGIVALERIGACSLNSDYNFTDASTKEYRYQAIYNFTYK